MRTSQRFLIIAALMPSLASAQTAQQYTSKNVLSIQPLSVVMLVLTGEYERRISKATSIGVGGTHWSHHRTFDRAERYNSADLKLRYYPAGEALHGFSLGGSVGVMDLTRDSVTTTRSARGASFGVLFEYQALLGQEKKFAVTVGAGAKKLTVDLDNDARTTSNDSYPTIRLSIGRAF